VLPVAQRVPHLLERRHLHVAALGVVAHRFETLAGSLLLEPVDDPRLGRDEKTLLRRPLREVDHLLGREDLRSLVPERHRLARTAAFRVDEQLCVGRLGLPALDVRGPDAGVDVALAQPDRQLASGHLLEPEAEVHVRQEEDLLLGRDRLDHRLRVPRGAAVVALRLHLGRRVHVGDDDRARVLRLPVAQLRGIDRGGERTAGAEVGQEHRLLGTEDRGRLGHEVDAAEDDRLRVGRGRLAREAERVADVVRDVLHLGSLVVVGEDHRVLLSGELADFFMQGRDGHWTSSETWSERAEWVRAPTETKSTPVSA
jgi:hypothetical protein